MDLICHVTFKEADMEIVVNDGEYHHRKLALLLIQKDVLRSVELLSHGPIGPVRASVVVSKTEAGEHHDVLVALPNVPDDAEQAKMNAEHVMGAVEAITQYCSDFAKPESIEVLKRHLTISLYQAWVCLDQRIDLSECPATYLTLA